MATNPRQANGHRRRMLRARILATETQCAICGGDVDKTLHYLDPMAPEVDEILPVSFGGDPLARANTRLAHRCLCNQRRGNGTREARTQPIGNVPTSRVW